MLANKVLLWDKMNNRWIAMYLNMPTSRCRCCIISYEVKVIVAGGITCYNPRTLTTAVEILCINNINPHNSYWITVQHLPFATYGSVPLMVGERLYLAAGYDGSAVATCKVVTASLPDLLQSGSNHSHTSQVWDRLSNVPYCSRSINQYQGHLATFSGDYFVGLWESVPLIHVYNPETDSWDHLDEVVPHDYYFGMSIHLSENKILFVGGLSGSSHNPNNLNDLLTTCWILTITPKHPSIIPY